MVMRHLGWKSFNHWTSCHPSRRNNQSNKSQTLGRKSKTQERKEFQDGVSGVPMLMDKYVSRGHGKSQITREEVTPHPEDSIQAEPLDESMVHQHLPSSSAFIPAGPSFTPARPTGLPMLQGSPVVTPPSGQDLPRVRLHGKQSHSSPESVLMRTRVETQGQKGTSDEPGVQLQGAERNEAGQSSTAGSSPSEVISHLDTISNVMLDLEENHIITVHSLTVNETKMRRTFSCQEQMSFFMTGIQMSLRSTQTSSKRQYCMSSIRS
eukprot:6490838-Amphidinium_carterae.3